jgi:DNA-binding transcriptional regulator LsrR (DeoR family)
MAAGDLSQRSLLVRDALPADVSVADLVAAGGVGDVLGWIVDADGRPLAHPVNDRVIGISLDDLGRMPNVILAAGGLHKVPIIRAALRRGIVRTLVTDEATARALLEGG